jgi:hypothetical protein
MCGGENGWGLSAVWFYGGVTQTHLSGDAVGALRQVA